MIAILDAPYNVAAFKAMGTVNKADYEAIVLPHTEKRLDDTGEINFLLWLDTDLGNFTLGAWLQDILLGLKHLTEWRRAAIVTDSEAIIKFTNGFSLLAPGEFKGFKPEQYEAALQWVGSHG